MLNLLKLNTCKSCFSPRYSYQAVRPISSSQLKEYYDLLNVTRGSSAKEIKDSFLKLSKVYHPDNKDTGSHAKFVALKQAYDAIKDGPPAASPYQSYTQQPPRRSSPTSRTYTRYDFEEDLKRRTYGQDYTSSSDNPYNRSSRFGGPYRNSSTPWEDFSRDREWSKMNYSHAYNNRYQKGRGLVSMTISLSVLAWVAIYTCILLSIDFEGYAKRRLERLKRETGDNEYRAYKRLVQERKETLRYLKEKGQKRISLDEEDREPELDFSDPLTNETRLESIL